MSKDFPFVEIPEHLKEIIGDAEAGTRLYRVTGTEEDAVKWADAVFEICRGDGAVSPGGVSMYAGVSRPGVHKKLRSGGLTGFIFHISKETLLLKRKKLTAESYGFIPVCECKAWAQELIKKRDKAEIVKEQDGDGDWDDSYLNVPPKHVKEKFKAEQKKGLK